MATQATLPRPLHISAAERRLCEAVRAGKALTLEPKDRIRARLLRRLLLSLPIEGGPYTLTGAGVRLAGATIAGRLRMENVVMAEGGPVAALELSHCIFEGGFCGSHGRFSRLCFGGSRFRGKSRPGTRKPVPTIDLTGAAVDSDLSMRGIRPDGKEDDLWIRATGVRVDGQVDFSCSHLRVPARIPARLMSELPVNALDLTLAEINGDFQFLNGARSEGSISARRAVFRGDVWMSGALIEAKERMALFFQSAEIGGVLMLDGRADDAAGTGDVRPFRAFGQVNLNDIQVGGSVSLSNVELRPSRFERFGRPEDGIEPDDPAARICLRLDEARIGDSVEIDIGRGERSRLYGRLVFRHMEVKNALSIGESYLGLELRDPRARVTIDAQYLSARQVRIANVEPLLWEEGEAGHPEMMALSIDLEEARIDSLIVADSWLNGRLRAPALKCSGDVVLDARIGVQVDLEGAEIGGTLDISELRLDEKAEGLVLRDARIAHALRLTHTSLTGSGALQLREARRKQIAGLRGMELVECLWLSPRGRRLHWLQTGFLFHNGRPFLLDGNQATLDSLVGHFGHSIAGPEDAAEYLRLHLFYVRPDRTPRMVLSDPAQLPPFLDLADSPAGDEAAAAAFAASVASLDPALGPPEAEKREGGEFLVSAWVLQGSAIVRLSSTIRAGAGPVRVRKGDEKTCLQVRREPAAIHQFLTHPKGMTTRRRSRWPAVPALDGMQPVDAAELPSLEAKLAHHVQTSCTIRGEADLTGLGCDMLDDDSGRAWGSPDRIRMNHFSYARTTWLGKDAEDPAPTLDRLRNSLRTEAARRLHPWLTSRPFLQRLLRGAEDQCSGWQTRLNWIYRQFDTRGLVMPSRYRIRQVDYAPQPFEQAIKVCRAEGREDYAVHFEIEKQKVEWRLFNARHWGGLAALGLLSALLWLLLTAHDTRDRWLIAAALAIGIAGASHAANFAMRFMFGYLRRPVRAIASLVAAFLIGWAGVHIANERHLMVIDVEPVATVAFQDRDGFRLGSEVKADPRARNVHCGDEISSALYALDVLIPLIDLREESRCEIGRANDVASAGPIEPYWVGALFGAFIESERFWVAAKAIYAIAGWFIVSLSILTFVHSNRTRGEPA